MDTFTINITKKVWIKLIIFYLSSIIVLSIFINVYSLSPYWYLINLPFIFPFILCLRKIAYTWSLNQSGLKRYCFGLFPHRLIRWEDFSSGYIEKDYNDKVYVLVYKQKDREKKLKFLEEEKGLLFNEFDRLLIKLKEYTNIEFKENQTTTD